MKFALSIVALLAGVSATPILRSTKYTPRWIDSTDFQLLNLARNLESLELAYWNQALQNYTDDDFNNAGYNGFRYFISLFRDQEIAHFTALNEAAGGGFENCTYIFPVSNPYEVLAIAQVVTTVGEGAFIGAEKLLSNGDYRQSGATILGNEARQNSKLREELGLDYFNAINFDTALTASQAYSLAKPFLDCPASNPPIEFAVIPPLMANFTDASLPHKGGDEIQVMWDASQVYLGDDVHITFLGDVYSISQPLTKTGDGMGTTTLPEQIHGTAFLVATNYDGPAPIPDGQNFAIGYVVTA